MKLIAAATAFICASSLLHAAESVTEIQTYALTAALDWTRQPVLLDALKAQNAANATLSQTQIDDLDQRWRSEVGKSETPLISELLGNPASLFLAEQVAKSDGRLVEVFLMDAHGLNVAASSATSDYWQGDEDKFTQTYGLGAGKIHASPVEFDDSTQTLLGQISLTVTDPDTHQPIGAITLGMNALFF